MNDFLKIQFWNTCDIDVMYQDGFKQELFLDSDLVISEPTIDEDGTKDSDEEFNPTFKKFDNRYEIEAVCPEFLIDALSGMQLCDNVWVFRKTGESAPIKDITLEVDWQRCYAVVKMSFRVDYFALDPCCGDPCEDQEPVILTTSVSAPDVTLTGTGLGFIQVQEFVGGVWVNLGAPGLAGKFSGPGLTRTPSALPATLRVHSYDNLCDYGYSESVEVCGGLLCNVSPPNGLKTLSIQGVNGSEIVLDWGDGSSQSITMDGNLNPYTNTYVAGNYELTITGDVNDVEKLELDGCDIDSYTGVVCFTSLIAISVDTNSIALLNDNELDNLTSFTTFEFNNNSISSIPSGYFDGATALGQITIPNNSLTTFPANLLDNNVLLNSLDLSDNSITSLPANWLDNNVLLLGVDFSNNALNVASVDYIFAIINSFGTNNGVLSTSGGTNGALTGGAANADLVALQGRGWTCFYN